MGFAIPGALRIQGEVILGYMYVVEGISETVSYALTLTLSIWLFRNDSTNMVIAMSPRGLSTSINHH